MKNWFLMLGLKISHIQLQIRLRFDIANLTNNMHLSLRISFEYKDLLNTPN